MNKFRISWPKVAFILNGTLFCFLCSSSLHAVFSEKGLALLHSLVGDNNSSSRTTRSTSVTQKNHKSNSQKKEDPKDNATSEKSLQGIQELVSLVLTQLQCSADGVYALACSSDQFAKNCQNFLQNKPEALEILRHTIDTLKEEAETLETDFLAQRENLLDEDCRGQDGQFSEKHLRILTENLSRQSWDQYPDRFKRIQEAYQQKNLLKKNELNSWENPD